MTHEPLLWARRYATYALQERLKVGNPNNDKIRGRIAAIRAGNLDGAPEVRAVFLYIAENAIAAAAREGGDVEQAPGETPQSGPKGSPR